MHSRHSVRNLLRKRILVLDGATGTELQKRGMPAGSCPEQWCLDNPRAMEDIHRSYNRAGSDIVYTCTFGGNRLKLGAYGIREVRESNRELAALARRAVGRGGLVAGDMGPTGHFVEPFGDLPFEEAVAVFREQAQGLLDGGVDLFVIETMMDIQEARAALLAVRDLTDRFTIVTMTYEASGRTLNGTDPVTALITLQSLGADAVGCNCSTGPDAMEAFIRSMKPYATVPLVAKPNAGLPRLSGTQTLFDLDPLAFAAFAGPLAAAGANLLGGCCGTTPDHIQALGDALRGEEPVLPERRSLSALSSARRHVIFDPGDPLWIVGERINPTGKKALQQELLSGKMSLVRQMAKDQERQGADLLDVNVGVPDIDEAKAMRQVVHLLSTATDLPLVIDSAKIETIEAALRAYPGRALINSISGERDKREKLLPLAARYGAMFILLPLTEGSIPETAVKRQAVIGDVFREARRHGFTREDIVVDGLVMTVASDPQAALETLRTVAWCRNRFRTVLGLSNVSFGMPERRWVNGAFMAMAQACGLTMAIANPAGEELMHLKCAGDVLMRKDRDAAAYIRRFAGGGQAEKAVPPGREASPAERVREAVLEGNREDIVPLLEAALRDGSPAPRLVEEIMIPAIVRVGDLFDRKVYFLPQLIAGAEAMKKGLAHLEPLLRKDAAGGDRGVVLLATVEGDIHDIGKNIVALMLQNHGYRVLDLGKDVPAEAVLAAMQREKPDVVGLSALMTTTMIHMREVIERARREGLGGRFVVGGAVLTKAYAESIGAAYARDGVEAVRVVAGLIQKKGSGDHERT